MSIRKLVQHDAERHSDVIKKLGKFFLNGKVTSTSAKCSIIWLIGEYHSLGKRKLFDFERKMKCATEIFR